MKHEKHQWGIFYLRKVVIYLDLDFFTPPPFSFCQLTKIFGKLVLLDVVGHQLLSCGNVDPHVTRVLNGRGGDSYVYLSKTIK